MALVHLKCSYLELPFRTVWTWWGWCIQWQSPLFKFCTDIIFDSRVQANLAYFFVLNYMGSLIKWNYGEFIKGALMQVWKFRYWILRILELYLPLKFAFFLKKVGYCLTHSIIFYACKQTFHISWVCIYQKVNDVITFGIRLWNLPIN